MDYLSDVTGSVDEYFMYNPEQIEQLVARLNTNPALYRSNLISLVDELKETEKQANFLLRKMTDEITYDLKTADLFENNIESFKDDPSTVEQACNKIDVAEKYLRGSNGFNETIEMCKTTFTNAISPNLLEILKGIDELSANDEEQIRELTTKFQLENTTVKNNAPVALKEFKSCIAGPRSECNTFFKGIFHEFEQLLNITSSASE